MKSIILFITLTFILGINIVLQSQSMKALEITYERQVHWSKIVQRLPYLSKEEKDRVMLTWGKEDNSDHLKYILQYTTDQSSYTYKPTTTAESGNDYAWRKDLYVIQRNFTNKTKTELREMLGKTYLIEDQLIKSKWKILNEIKEVAGYICMKAEMTDTIKNQKIVAWFTDALPYQIGPEDFYGLPGAILELDKNYGDVVIIATDVKKDIAPMKIKLPKMKGKKINTDQYISIIDKHIKESIKAQKNPYWSINY